MKTKAISRSIFATNCSMCERKLPKKPRFSCLSNPADQNSARKYFCSFVCKRSMVNAIAAAKRKGAKHD